MATPGIVGQVLGHYRVLDMLGAGGMGEVYRAHDTQLERDVALKVLPARETGDDEVARARLLREARSAALLNHPNICTVYEVGEAAGRPFIAMELVPGESLLRRLSRGPMSSAEVFVYGAQLAGALDHAHRHGVIHRDMKSGNVMISADDRVKVLDFGIARRDSRAEQETASRTLTQAGAIVGTLAYMSPEQLRGGTADARSDIWALGVVLYEMVTGALPFAGKTSVDLTLKILEEPLPVWPERVPPALRVVIERCLEKRPESRYASSAEVQAALVTPQTATAARLQLLRRNLLFRKLTFALLALLVIALTAVGVWRSRTQRGTPQISSLAVLPLENLSADPEQAYLADGLHEGLITELSTLSGLRRVTTRSSVLHYRKTDKPLSQIARELGVDAIVTGAVQRSGDHVQLTAHLINPATDEQIWGGKFEGQVRDAITLQDELVTAIAGSIRVQLTSQDRRRIGAPPSVDPDAYDAYLKAKFQNRSREGFDAAEKYLNDAIAKDPKFALAHYALGRIWFERADIGLEAPSKVMLKATTELQKALELDPNLSDAHYWMAIVHWSYEWDKAAAEPEYRRAIAADDKNAAAHFQYADFLMSHQRKPEWEREMRRTMELDPPNTFYRVFYGWHLVNMRRYDEGISVLKSVVNDQADSAHMGLWGAYYRQGKYADAFAEARLFFQTIKDDDTVAALDSGYREGGYAVAMRRGGDVLAARSARQHVSAIRIARLYAHGGDKDRALQWLATGYERHEVNLVHIGVGWDWDSLRGDPRFQDLLRKMNLPA